jgi:glycosyltransferase involved in cell wall biosynthesis
LNNPEKAKEMGQVGKKMVKERFDQQKIIKKIIKFWQDLAS